MCCISPWSLSPNNKLIIRNRYKRLRCFKKDGSIPAYKVFYHGLEILFGPEQAKKLAIHFDNGGGDIVVDMLDERYELIRNVLSEWHKIEGFGRLSLSKTIDLF